MHKAIYVTGAPAAGKSSTIQLLQQQLPDIQVWEYGSRLTEFLQAKGAALSDQDDLRRRSGNVSGPGDIAELDERLLDWVAECRQRAHVVIDSHPVTKEDYGFRVTAFSGEKFRQLAPDEVWLFYVAPEVTIHRIQQSPAGRPTITLEEARTHSAIQAAVACTLAISIGCPVYMFDTDTDRPTLINRLKARLDT